MFLSASRIESNKATGLGVAGRRMASGESESPATTKRVSDTGILARALRRDRKAASDRAAA